MSADNFYEVFEYEGKWYVVHKFASSAWSSGDEEEDREVDAYNAYVNEQATKGDWNFDTRQDALNWIDMHGGYTEYGVLSS